MNERSNGAVVAASVGSVVLCAAGPAVVGAVAGGVLSGWIAIAVACALAAALGAVLYRRRGC